jgi:hypothetical protein
VTIGPWAMRKLGPADSKGLGNQSVCEKELDGRWENCGSREELDGQWEVWDQFHVAGDGRLRNALCVQSRGMRCLGIEGGMGEGSQRCAMEMRQAMQAAGDADRLWVG